MSDIESRLERMMRIHDEAVCAAYDAGSFAAESLHCSAESREAFRNNTDNSKQRRDKNSAALRAALREELRDGDLLNKVLPILDGMIGTRCPTPLEWKLIGERVAQVKAAIEQERSNG